MSKYKITYPIGATLIDPDEAKDLIPDYISTMGELNQVEQSNIADAFVWAGRQALDELLTGTFVFKLHKRMFNQVWKWAGQTRRSNKNIGVMKEHIMNDLAQLLGDAKYWVEHVWCFFKRRIGGTLSSSSCTDTYFPQRKRKTRTLND